MAEALCQVADIFACCLCSLHLFLISFIAILFIYCKDYCVRSTDENKTGESFGSVGKKTQSTENCNSRILEFDNVDVFAC